MNDNSLDLNATDSDSSLVTIPNNAIRNTVRPRVIAFVLIVFGVILIARLLHIQLVIGSQLSEWRNQQQISTEPIPARPGTLVDRRGRMLAGTITRKSLYCVPSRIGNPKEFADALASVIEIDASKLIRQIKDKPSRKFLWIQRRLSEEEVIAIQSLDLTKSLWGFRNEYLRIYPQERLAAHVLGHRDIDGQPHGGVEEAVNHLLKGTAGQRTISRDALGRVIEVDSYRTTPAQNGETVTLTIDVVIQAVLERSLSEVMQKWTPNGTCGVVIDPRTGEILAMASLPNYNPNHPREDNPAAWKNLALAAQFEPGSTFKPFIVAWGLQNEVIKKDTTLFCEYGKYKMGRRLLRDHHSYGELSLMDVLVKSSNIGMAKIGERLTNEELYRAAITFGFGGKTGLDLPGEVTGKLRPLKKWTRYSTGSIPMGQELSATPLQILSATAVLANHGSYVQPHLFKLSVEQKKSIVHAQLIDRDIADWIVQNPLRQVVVRGTGRKANLKAYSVFGKTGTAQKYDAKLKAYSHTKLVCSFVGGAPSHDPEVLVIICVDEPHGTNLGGGSVAAPAVAKVIAQILQQKNALPELQPTQSVQ